MLKTKRMLISKKQLVYIMKCTEKDGHHKLGPRVRGEYDDQTHCLYKRI